MATLKEENKLIRRKYKDLVNGYIRRVQRKFSFKQNSYYIIPVPVNYLSIIYHGNRNEFNTKLCGQNLKFIDYETVEKIKDEGSALCLFGDPITESMCNIFRIEFTIVQSGIGNINEFEKQAQFCPYFGFVGSSSPSILMTELSKLKTWNTNYAQYAKYDDDGFKSFAIDFYSMGMGVFSCYGRVKYESLQVPYGQVKGSIKLRLKPDTITTAHTNNRHCKRLQLNVNDTFMFVHNFAESQCSAFYNNEKIFEINSFSEKCIIPTVSLCFPGERIKVTKYEFDCLAC